jgi:dihydrodipicolinate reductase
MLALAIALIGAAGGIGAFIVAWSTRREQRQLLAAQASKTEAERNNIKAVTATSLQARIDKLEADARARMEEIAVMYETLMSAIARNRTLEAERARLLRFLRQRYPDVYRAYCDEYGESDHDSDSP